MIKLDKQFAVESAIVLAKYSSFVSIYKDFNDAEEVKKWNDRIDGARFLFKRLTGVSVSVYTYSEELCAVDFYRFGSNDFTAHCKNYGRVYVVQTEDGRFVAPEETIQLEF